MTASLLALDDSMTMFRRSLVHMRRYKSLIFFIAGLPVLFLLLFVYVFGGTLGNGLGSQAGGLPGGRDAYIAYVVPGILLMAVAGAGQGVAISIAMDIGEGIITRFRTMPISQASVLVGHVVGSLIQTGLAVLLVVGVAVTIGFRPTTGPLEWLEAAGLLVLVTIAITWLSIALGLAANSVETASNTPMFLTILPLVGSGFVPTASMPEPLRWFADNQPFTPIIETLRGLLLGTPIGDSGWLSIAWSVAIAALGFAWARRLYARDRVR